MVKRKQTTGEEERKPLTGKIKLKKGVSVKAGQPILPDMIEQPKNLLTESLAIFLWSKYDRTRLTDDWNNETPQRQLRWRTDAESVRQLVDEYYEE